LDHPRHEEQWAELFRAFGRALADAICELEQKEKIKVQVDQLSGKRLQRLFIAWLRGSDGSRRRTRAMDRRRKK
jgi:hypothetical protein